MALLEDFEIKKTKDTPGQTRSTKKVNLDWEGGLQKTAGVGKTTIDKEFAKTAYSDQTLGPRGLGVSSKRRSPEEAEQAEQAAYAESIQAIEQARASARFRTNVISKKKTLVKALRPDTQIARVKATAVNTGALSWAGTLWLFVQLPFAILGIATLGVVGVIEQVTGSTSSDPSWWQSLLATATSAVANLVSFFGVDFLQIATGLYLLSITITLAIGLITILALYLQYTLAFMRPLSGDAMGLKWGMLLLAFIGYSLPLANMFPFVLGWAIVVWFFPK